MMLALESLLVGVSVALQICALWILYRIGAALVLVVRRGQVGYDIASLEFQAIRVFKRAVLFGVVAAFSAPLLLK